MLVAPLVAKLKRMVPLNYMHNLGLSAKEQEYWRYLSASYPRNHNYKIYNKLLYPSRHLLQRFTKLQALYPQPLTSLLDLGVSKGFFVFSAAQEASCERAVGFDVFNYDIEVCSWLKTYLQQDKVQFMCLTLPEIAARLQEFGGPFQTVLIVNMYQYLYFGSERQPGGYLDHHVIFAYLRQICSQRLIFNNRMELADCQNSDYIAKVAAKVQNDYTASKIIAAASNYFKVQQHGYIAKYPLWTMDVA